MQAFKLNSSAAACLLLALTSSMLMSTNAYSMEEMCEQMPGAGYIGNPSNCAGWGYCKNNLLAGTGTCNSGLLYNYKKGICDYASEVECTTSAKQTCANYKSPVIIPDPQNCTQYAYCDGSGGYETGACPSEQVFNGNTGGCVWASTYTCPSQSICQLMQNNIFVGNPTKCGEYVQCQNGAGKEGQCTPGNFFHTDTGYCSNVNPCTAVVNPSPGTGLPPTTNTSVCKAFVATGEKYQYFTDSTTCYGFYVCTSDTGPGTWGSCPENLQFDPELQKCVSPASFACTYNRCGNTHMPFATVAGTGCTTYTSCTNQQANGKVVCPTDYPYIDEIAGQCIKTLPTYPICTIKV